MESVHPTLPHLDIAVAEAARVEEGQGGEQWPHDGADRGGRREGDGRCLMLAALKPPKQIAVDRVLHHEVEAPARLADDLWGF